MFAKRSLDCQGDCSRCYSISKLSQMLYAFIADANLILLPVPSPALLRYPLPYWMVFALCFFFLRHMPYNLRGDNPAFYLLQGPFSNSACFVLRRLPLPPKREVSTSHYRKKMFTLHYAILCTTMDLSGSSLHCAMYISYILQHYFLIVFYMQRFFPFLLSSLPAFLDFQGLFFLYIYILWFCILLSLRCFGITLLYMAVFFPLFFLSFDVEISF